MTNWPPVWLLFVTYRRTEASLRTIASIKEHLHYPNLHWHICDDGSGEADDGSRQSHVDVLKEAIGGDVTAHEMDRQHKHDFNVGGNINRGMQIANDNGAGITLMNLDDWVLLKDLDLRPMVDVLDTYPQVGAIRLSYWVPGNAGVAMLYECPRLGNEHYIWMRLIRRWCIDNPWRRDTYLFSMQPYLSHIRFFEAYGYYKEGLHPGQTETSICAQYNDSPWGEDGPQILFPIGKRIVHAWYKHGAHRQEHYAEIEGDLAMPDMKGLV